MTAEEAELRLTQLFMPYAINRISEIQQKQTKFAHYTSAYAALQIIEKKTVWMRNAVVMNDFSEVQHGQNCLKYSWHNENAGGRLRAVLDGLRSGLAQEVAQEFDTRLHDRQVQSYLISVSEHGDATLDEDKFGRLSMWRAYGGNTNVALILNNTPFISDSNPMNAFTTPVLYCDKERFNAKFIEMVEGLERNFSFLQRFEPASITHTLGWAFHSAALSTKHPGFAEEKEWRIIHCPTLFPSDKILFDIETIEHVPQRVYKLKMENHPDEGFFGAALPEVLDEIIIGPTAFPWPIYDALATKLEENGVENSQSRIRISDIPLRR